MIEKGGGYKRVGRRLELAKSLSRFEQGEINHDEIDHRSSRVGTLVLRTVHGRASSDHDESLPPGNHVRPVYMHMRMCVCHVRTSPERPRRDRDLPDDRIRLLRRHDSSRNLYDQWFWLSVFLYTRAVRRDVTYALRDVWKRGERDHGACVRRPGRVWMRERESFRRIHVLSSTTCCEASPRSRSPAC